MGARINLFGLGQLSRSPSVTAKQLTNLYCEIRPAGEKSKIVAYGTPGLDSFTDFGANSARGGIEVAQDAIALIVHRNILWQVDRYGVQTNRGTLSTNSGRVSMSFNGVQVMIVDGTYGYIYNTDTFVFAQITDADFPSNPVTCGCLARRFVVSFLNSSRFYWSAIDDGLLWDALDFANAETNPDAIQAIYVSNGQLTLLGSETSEFFGISGLADPVFIPLQGNATEWGIAAIWSLAKFDNSFACLMKNRMGEVMVAQMNGYLPKKISTIDLDEIINDYANVSDASAYSYMLGGHPMYVINFPSAGFTWLYDGSTGIWSSLQSFGITRHIGEFSLNLTGRTLVADYSDGTIYTLNDDSLTENSNPIYREIIGETVASQGEEFFPVDVLRLDMEVGVGTATGQGLNPQIGLEVSRDNGKTYGPQMMKPIGATGQYTTRVEWRRLGTMRYFTPKIRLTDPVRAVFVSACLNPET